jgi:hypothetical protein
LLQNIKVFIPALPAFYRAEQVHYPRQPFTAGRTPAAGLTREETLDIMYRADRTGLVVDH